MATFARQVHVEWVGGLMDGNGTATAGTGAFSLPVTFPSRIGEADGKTTPEELLAGSHAVCYAMGLTATIGRLGGKAQKVSVTATVTAEKSDAGIRLQSSHLAAVVEGLEGLEAETLAEIAAAAEQGCPISNAIRGAVTITVEATVGG
jgi:osmotically inducible protein OsmC